MSSLMKACVLLLSVSMATCDVRRQERWTVVDQDGQQSNDLTPPLDPAINNFAKEPRIPLIPTCEHPGYFRDPFNCGKFYRCHYSQDIPTTFYCKHGLIFNEHIQMCDDPNFVDC